MPGDDPFEVLLKRCGERLSEINLSVPDLEKASPRPAARLQLSTPQARPPEKPRPAAVPAPPPPPAPPEEPEEEEVFPPAALARTPAPAPTPRPAPTSTPAPAPPRAASNGARALAAAAAAMLLALGYWAPWRSSGAADIALPGADAAAVRPGSGDILVVRGSELLTLSRAGQTLSRGDLSGRVVSLRWLQNSVWSADGVTPEVIERREGERPTAFRLNHVPQEIFVQGNAVWTVEKGGHAIHQYMVSRSIMGAMLQPLDLFEVLDLTAESIALDEEGTLWVADDESRGLFRLRAQGGVYKIVDRAPLSPLLGPTGTLHGLTLDGDAIWIFSRPEGSGTPILRRIPLSRLTWTPA